MRAAMSCGTMRTMLVVLAGCGGAGPGAATVVDAARVDAPASDGGCEAFAPVAMPPLTPPFEGTAFLDPGLITEADPTSFVDLTYAGQAPREMFDRRTEAFGTVNAYLFPARFGSSKTVEIQVNFVLLLSPASLASGWGRDELDAALVARIEATTRLVSVKVAPCELPAALRSRRWIDGTVAMAAVALPIADAVAGWPGVSPVAAVAAPAPASVPGLDPDAARVAIAIAQAAPNGGGSRPILDEAALLMATGLAPDILGHAVADLEAHGLVEVEHVPGGGADAWGCVVATYQLPHLLRRLGALAYDPMQDVEIVAVAVVAGARVAGDELVKLTGLPEGRLLDACDYLEAHDLALVRRAIGRRVGRISATWATRRFVSDHARSPSSGPAAAPRDPLP